MTVAFAGGVAPVKSSVVVASVPETAPPVVLQAKVSDVRDAGTLLDYAGELQLQTGLRITDRGSGSTQREPATAQDLNLPVTLPCAVTLDLATGSLCSVSTTLDAVMPGAVAERARSVWQLDQVAVRDGGPDGLADTADNAVFARQGLFIP